MVHYELNPMLSAKDAYEWVCRDLISTTVTLLDINEVTDFVENYLTGISEVSPKLDGITRFHRFHVQTKGVIFGVICCRYTARCDSDVKCVRTNMKEKACVEFVSKIVEYFE
jgi:hypothetical protein